MRDQPHRTKFQSSSQEQSRSAREGNILGTWIFSRLSQCIQTFILFLLSFPPSHLQPVPCGCCLQLTSSTTSTLSVLMHWTLLMQYTYLKLQHDYVCLTTYINDPGFERTHKWMNACFLSCPLEQRTVQFSGELGHRGQGLRGELGGHLITSSSVAYIRTSQAILELTGHTCIHRGNMC